MAYKNSRRYIKASRGEPFDSVDNMEDLILDALGEQGFIEAVTKALDYDTKKDIYEYIIRVYDLE